jgi:hypothetical protein
MMAAPGVFDIELNDDHIPSRDADDDDDEYNYVADVSYLDYFI